jgi:hypothetical protein
MFVHMKLFKMAIFQSATIWPYGCDSPLYMYTHNEHDEFRFKSKTGSAGSGIS